MSKALQEYIININFRWILPLAGEEKNSTQTIETSKNENYQFPQMFYQFGNKFQFYPFLKRNIKQENETKQEIGAIDFEKIGNFLFVCALIYWCCLKGILKRMREILGEFVGLFAWNMEAFGNNGCFLSGSVPIKTIDI